MPLPALTKYLMGLNWKQPCRIHIGPGQQTYHISTRFFKHEGARGIYSGLPFFLDEGVSFFPEFFINEKAAHHESSL